MVKTTVKVSGMACGMCEAHINDAVRRDLSVKKVTSSRAKGETVILSDAPLDREKLRRAIEGAGYTFVSAGEEEFEKKGLLFRLLPKGR